MRTFAYLLAVAFASTVAPGNSVSGQSYAPQQPVYYPPQNPPRQPIPSPQRPQSIPQQPTVDLKAFDSFDVRLLQKVSSGTIGNFMISPASIKAVLFMLAEGAIGSSKDELLNTLGLTDITQARQAWKDYYKQLRASTNGVTMESANALFLSGAYKIVTAYDSRITTFYDSKVRKVNFTEPQLAANKINRWIRDKTHNYIPQLVDAGSFDADALMVVANALYFKGVWETKFSTVPNTMCFNVNGACSQTQMMDVESDFKYYHDRTNGFHAVELPYIGGSYGMLLLLPHDSVQTLTDYLSNDLLQYTIKRMEINEMNIYMPKFDIEFSEELGPVLKMLGIQKIFGKDANLVDIVQGNQSPQVDNIIHKTRLVVNEEGSVAAAGSGAMVVPLMGSTSIRLVFDRPFLFFIRDITNNAIIFAGRVNDPTKKVVQNTNPKQFTKKPVGDSQLYNNRKTNNNQQFNNQNYNTKSTIGQQSENDGKHNIQLYDRNNPPSFGSSNVERYPQQYQSQTPPDNSYQQRVESYQRLHDRPIQYPSVATDQRLYYNNPVRQVNEYDYSHLQNERLAVSPKKLIPAESNRMEAKYHNLNPINSDAITFIN